MIQRIVEIFACIIETYIIIDFITKYLGMKNQNYKMLKCGSVFLVALGLDILITFGFLNENIAIGILILLCFLYGVVCLKGNVLEKVFAPVFAYLLITVINTTIMTIFNTVMENQYSDLIDTQIELRIVLIALTKLTFFIVTQAILKIKNKKLYELKMAEWIIVVGMFGITTGVSVMLNEILLRQKYVSSLFAVIMLSLICMTVFTYFIMLKISRNNEKAKEMELLQMQLRQQETSIQIVQERYEEISTIRHDMKNYVSNALSLLRDKKYEATEKYLQNFQDMKIGKYKSYVATDNALINAVLNAKLSYAEEQGIDFQCLITGNLGKIENYDMTILLSNLLDNSIEACEHMSWPKIDVKMNDKAEYLHICIKNSISESVLRGNKELRTTKKDKKFHGYGTKSCRQIVGGMDGEMDILEEDGWFIVDILLPREKL